MLLWSYQLTGTTTWIHYRTTSAYMRNNEAWLSWTDITTSYMWPDLDWLITTKLDFHGLILPIHMTWIDKNLTWYYDGLWILAICPGMIVLNSISAHEYWLILDNMSPDFIYLPEWWPICVPNEWRFLYLSPDIRWTLLLYGLFMSYNSSRK